MEKQNNDSLQGIVDDEDLFGGKSIDEFCDSTLNPLRMLQKSVTELKGWQYFIHYSGVQRTMRKVNSSVENIISKIFRHNGIHLVFENTLASKFGVLREGNDALLEKVNSSLDEACGNKKRPALDFLDSSIQTIRGAVNSETGQRVVLHAPRNLEKPQLFFKEKINNSAKEPFIPIIEEKPHSLKPLSVLLCIDDDGHEYYSHPYAYELNHWSPSEDMLQQREPIPYQPIASTTLTIIENIGSLERAVEELKEQKEIGVDLEHHSFRSYQGLTCLMQISSRIKDYIVDTLALRGHLSVLNEVFANPKITKIFHGADSDILWLQRDCGVYVVNMFDTHQASLVLQYPSKSLAALLLKFCSIQANKTYQLADWRTRPLPEHFLDYARGDSHYLLYIYDCLKNELLDKGNEMKNLLHATFNRSIEICLKRYEKPIITPDSHLTLYRRSRKTFNSRQMYALMELYQWRDKTAREQDESVDFILPQHMLLQISEVLPKEMQGILACCNPIPNFVKIEQVTLHQIVQQARSQPLLEIERNLSQITSQKTSAIYDITSESLRKHDLSQVEENPSGLSTLLGEEESLLGDLFSQNPVAVKVKKKSVLFVNNMISNQNSKDIELEFRTPYQRYLSYLQLQPLLDERRKKEQSVSTEDRIQNVFSHISTININGEREKNADSSVLKDTDRIKRLEDHIRTTSNDAEETESVINAASQDLKNVATIKVRERGKKKMSIKERKVLALTKKSKRKNEEEEGGEQTKSLKLDESPEEEEITESPSQLKPFNYETADFSVFCKKKAKAGFKYKKNIKEKFKGKKFKNETTPKSGIRSITYSKKS